MIDRVAWPVPPGRARGYTRPEQLVAVLGCLGALDPSCSYIAHGRSRAGLTGLVDQVAPGRLLGSEQSGTAILSPVFLTHGSKDAAWIDLYDDWFLSPNTHPYYRLLALRGYRALRNMADMAATVTVNTTYMANLLTPVETVRIPNGVDESLGDLPSGGSASRRLILLGEFFPGRTDFDTLVEVASRPEFEEVIVGAPGRSKEMTSAIRALSSRIGPRLKVHQWLSPNQLAGLVGERTAVLVPHLVCDYTLSQDLLKVYQCLALGMRVICPRLLWPESLDVTYGLLLDHGVDLDGVLADWIDADPPTATWRKQFAAQHSWKSRGEAVLAATGSR
jgi:hypothetical protein